MRARTTAALLGVLATVCGVCGTAAAATPGCPHLGRTALAADPRPHALRVFAIQFRQDPAAMVTPSSFSNAIDCVMRAEVKPYLARGRPNVVVFDEDLGIETLAVGPRGAAARKLLRDGVPSCRGKPFPCATLATLSALDRGYASVLARLYRRFPSLRGQLGRAFVAATDTFARVFMGTMATVARRYGVYVAASNTQAPFRLARGTYQPTAGRAYNQMFLWGPRGNLLADNRKVPLTSFEQALGVAPGPARGPAARANLRPVPIPGTGARLGFATSLPAFAYGTARRGHECDDVALTYMRCLDRLGANVLVQADANDGQWSGPDGSDTAEQWQPLSWMGSAWRSVSDPSVRFTYAVNPMMVGNLSDTPFDGQSAILERGRRGSSCNYVGNRAFVPGEDDPALRGYAGAKPQFLALAPWVLPDAPRPRLRQVGADLAAGTGPYRYVQTALAADLPFPADRERRGCVLAGR